MPVSISLQAGEIDRLEEYVRRHKLQAVPVKSRYERLRIKDGGIGLILYKSGKLVYDDSRDMREIIDRILETEDLDYVLGTDEAGKGEWYGPLVVECVALKAEEVSELRKMGIRDSKNLTRKKLLELGGRLVEMGFVKKPLVLMPETYNLSYSRFKAEGKTLNDLMAWAHARAIKDVVRVLDYRKAKVVVDEFDVKRTEFRLGDLDRTGLEIIQKTKGESETSVAAASILAKHVFEGKVDELNRRFGIDLRNSKPGDIGPGILPKVAKLHFKNVAR